MKIAVAIEIFLLAICPLSVAKNDLEQAKHEFTNLRGDLAGPKGRVIFCFFWTPPEAYPHRTSTLKRNSSRTF